MFWQAQILIWNVFIFGNGMLKWSAYYVDFNMPGCLWLSLLYYLVVLLLYRYIINCTLRNLHVPNSDSFVSVTFDSICMRFVKHYPTLIIPTETTKVHTIDDIRWERERHVSWEWVNFQTTDWGNVVSSKRMFIFRDVGPLL